MNQRSLRVLALILVLSPWIYVPTPLKELGFIILGAALFFMTLDIRKKKAAREEGTSLSSPETPLTTPLVSSI